MELKVPRILERCPPKLLALLAKILSVSFLLIKGGRFCGKTQFLARLLVHLCQTYNGFRGCWGRGIKNRLGESARPMFKRFIPQEQIARDTEDIIELINGSSIRFRAFCMERGLDANGLDDVDLLVVDESQKMSKATIDNVIDSVRNEDGTSAKFFITNPFTMSDPVEQTCVEYGAMIVSLDYRDNPACPLDKVEEAELLRDNNPSAWRRRMLGFPDLSDPDSLLQPTDFDIPPEIKLGNEGCDVVAGYDPAGDSGDNNCLYISEQQNNGLYVENEVINWTGLTEMESIGKIRNIVIDKLIKAIAVDAVGIGSAVFDRMREVLCPLGVKVIPFKSSYSSIDPGVAKNERDRIFWDLRQAVQSHDFIIKDQMTIYELCATHYHQDSAGFVAIEPKKSIKKEIHHSPNNADAAALCLYALQNWRREKRKITNYGTFKYEQKNKMEHSNKWFIRK